MDCYQCKQPLSDDCPYTPMAGIGKKLPRPWPDWSIACPSCSFKCGNGKIWSSGEILSVPECVDCPMYAKCLTLHEVDGNEQR